MNEDIGARIFQIFVWISMISIFVYTMFSLDSNEESFFKGMMIGTVTGTIISRGR